MEIVQLALAIVGLTYGLGLILFGFYYVRYSIFLGLLMIGSSIYGGVYGFIPVNDFTTHYTTIKE